ncbi:hypothetical protein P7C70_g5420, partial [Phenoliferia sp. Uapishka_3]
MPDSRLRPLPSSTSSLDPAVAHEASTLPPQAATAAERFTPHSTSCLALLENYFLRLGPLYKGVDQAERVRICSATGLDLGALKIFWMARAREQKRQRKVPATTLKVNIAPLPATPFQNLPTPPPLERSFSLPTILISQQGQNNKRSYRASFSPRLSSVEVPSKEMDDVQPKSNPKPTSPEFFSSEHYKRLSEKKDSLDERRSKKARHEPRDEARSAEVSTDAVNDPELKQLLESIQSFLPRYRTSSAFTKQEEEDLAYDRLRASVGEVDNVYFFQASALEIGSWAREVDMTLARPDLRVYFSPANLSFCFWSSYDLSTAFNGERFYSRITLPLSSLTSIKFFSSPSSDFTPALIIFSRDPSLPIHFHVARPQPTPADWIALHSDAIPGWVAAAQSQIFSFKVFESSHAFERIFDSIPRFLQPGRVRDDFLGKVWTASWPRLAMEEDEGPRMRAGEVLLCLEQDPIWTEWGEGEIVSLKYPHIFGGREVHIRRAFVLPAPQQLFPEWCLKEEEGQESSDDSDLSFQCQPSISDEVEAPSDEDQSRTPGRDATSPTPYPFDLRRYWTGQIPPSAFYLTPPPESELSSSRRSSIDSGDSNFVSLPVTPLTFRSPSPPPLPSHDLDYMGKLEDFIPSSPDDLPSAEFDYSLNIAVAFRLLTGEEG